ncbi:MAG: LysE family translocator [Desulfobacteraceae bacterium]|jgi:threonine/homoserine/homoserine lactone efflux protein
MTIETSFALLMAMIISAAVPGPGVFACVAKALASGFKASTIVILGIVLGNIIFLIIAILGLSAIAQMIGDMFIVIKWGGGAYLFWLGLKMWRSDPKSLESGKKSFNNKRSEFISGLIVPFSNPKVILFYVSLLPSFLDLSVLNTIDTVIAVFLIAFSLISVLTGYSYIASRSRRIFASHQALKNLNRGAGATMMGTGVMIAAQSN